MKQTLYYYLENVGILVFLKNTCAVSLWTICFCNLSLIYRSLFVIKIYTVRLVGSAGPETLINYIRNTSANVYNIHLLRLYASTSLPQCFCDQQQVPLKICLINQFCICQCVNTILCAVHRLCGFCVFFFLFANFYHLFNFI